MRIHNNNKPKHAKWEYLFEIFAAAEQKQQQFFILLKQKYKNNTDNAAASNLAKIENDAMKKRP